MTRRAVTADLQAWYPKLRPGGVLAGHDYLDGMLPEGNFGVKSAVDAFQRQQRLKVRSTREAAWPSWYLIKPVAKKRKRRSRAATVAQA